MPDHSAPLEEIFGRLTEETPAPGVRVLQPARGYRYGVEVYALAGFALGVDASGARSPAAEAVDLGAGSGVLAFLLAARGVESWAVEHDAAWVRLARASRLRCDPAVQARVHIVRTDVRAMFLRPARYDLVVTNPPWFDPGEGPVAPDPRKAGARAMLHGRVGDFVTAGLELADRVCVATREERMNELVPAGAHLRRLARLGRRVVLAEVRPGAGVCVEEELDLPAIYAYFRDSPAVPLPLERP